MSDWLKKAMAYFPKSCQTIRRWIDEITAYFDNRTTQGTVEGINGSSGLGMVRYGGINRLNPYLARDLID